MTSNNTKNYQKTQSRTASKQKNKQINISKQTIKYLVMNPLQTQYRYHQEMYSE